MADLETSAPTEAPTGEPTGSLDGINPAFKEGGDKPGESAADKAVAAAMKKLKVKGKEIEVDESKYHEYAQKGAAATETWQEAARMKKEADALRARLKQDPYSVLSDPEFGLDLDKLAEDRVWAKIQAEQEKLLPPEERQRLQEKRLLEKYQKEEAERKEQETQAKSQQMREHFKKDYDEKIAKALGAAKIPKNVRSVKRMTDYMLLDVEEGIAKDPSEYVAMVEQDYIDDIQHMLNDLDGDQLLRFLGPNFVKKFREADVKSVRTTTPQEGHTFVPGKGMVKQQPVKKLSGKDWERDLMKGFLGR
jgi:hypothetical protein